VVLSNDLHFAQPNYEASAATVFGFTINKFKLFRLRPTAYVPTRLIFSHVIKGKTAPGREWLIDQFFVNAIKAIDEGVAKPNRIFIYEPIARYSDPVADRRFQRAVKND